MHQCWKTENGCKIQNSVDRHAWMMLHFKLVKNVEDDDAHLAALNSKGACLMHGTQVTRYLLQVGQVHIHQELFVMIHIFLYTHN